MIFLAIGGTALICKYGIKNFNLLPAYLDLALKRLGPALAINSLILYPASIISKRIFVLSAQKEDRSSRRYEASFYLAVIVFCFTVFVRVGGTKIETFLPTHDGQPPTSIPAFWEIPIFIEDWSLSIHIDTIDWFALIWLIWIIALAACIFSRFFEWSWRDRPENVKKMLLPRRRPDAM
jgi:hypothetical protein